MSCWRPRARRAAAGRPACFGPCRAASSQVLLVLRDGRELSEHENPGEALLHVLRGRVRLTADDERCDLSANEHIVIPQQRHGLLALEDAAVLLTVVGSRS